MLPPKEEPSVPKFRGKTEADEFYLSLALHQRVLSDDPKALHVPQSGVGAVIAGAEGTIATSANVLPPRIKQHMLENNKAVVEADRYHLIEHAERAAIFHALLEGKDLEGSTIYCTRFPCSDCARAIVWAGIKRAVFATGYADETRWLESQRAALTILRQAGVIVRVLRSAESPSRTAPQ